MFDIGWPELLVVAIVLIVVVGPKDLPRMLRTFGRTTGKLRAMAGDFRRQFDEALKEAELDDVKTVIDSARSMNPASNIKKHLNPLKQAGEEIKSSLADAAKPSQSAPAKGSEPASKAVHTEAPAKSGAAAMPGGSAKSPPRAGKAEAPAKGSEPASRAVHAEAPAKSGATAMPGEGAKAKPAPAKARAPRAAKPKTAAAKPAAEARKPAAKAAAKPAAKTAARKPATAKGTKA